MPSAGITGSSVRAGSVCIVFVIAPGSGRRTHVSFEPPPREEFTIIEPSSSATRVRPPGITRTSVP